MDSSSGTVSRSGIYGVAFRDLAGIDYGFPAKFPGHRNSSRFLADNKYAVNRTDFSNPAEKIFTHGLCQGGAVGRRKMWG